ncbi:hypothetical protein NDU88_010627 [Pleurodeles waltl]|uniref:Uncharacterized protein n=1 Tax=Pleurodeles waltl TaxID=8319 RepID=A0AAV7PW28_PLEWA|nr:hypothetical protein NDU88_010627 [Pleurodeles waltl]
MGVMAVQDERGTFDGIQAVVQICDLSWKPAMSAWIDLESADRSEILESMAYRRWPTAVSSCRIRSMAVSERVSTKASIELGQRVTADEDIGCGCEIASEKSSCRVDQPDVLLEGISMKGRTNSAKRAVRAQSQRLSVRGAAAPVGARGLAKYPNFITSKGHSCGTQRRMSHLKMGG